MRAAILAEQAPSPKLAKIIELVDQRQHMVMTAEEVRMQ